VLAVGPGCSETFAETFPSSGSTRPFFLSSRSVRPRVDAWRSRFEAQGLVCTVWDGLRHEPTIQDFKKALAAAREFGADAVVGVGGGSVLDTAKLVAALIGGGQEIEEVFGIGRLARRNVPLVCLPTTAGTGSEVSPNAILLDERAALKMGVVSPHLVPDEAYVDPELSFDVPPAVTASTGMDALTHCIEAYANRFAHEVVDVWALEGIRRISRSLAAACRNGADATARNDLAMGSLYGGLCLGPVNTGAVHALAYPLGGAFRVPHGVANSLLLPHVLAFNLNAAPDRYAEIALALGEHPGLSFLETAEKGLARIRRLSAECGIPGRLSDLGIGGDALEELATSAMTVTRLLERNPRQLTRDDVLAIYRAAL
jgi:alcohol dehydrogenase class IV